MKLANLFKVAAMVAAFTISQNGFAQVLKNLDSKTIFRTYFDEMFTYYPEENELSEIYQGLPYVGVQQGDEAYLAVLRDVTYYENQAGEGRYLAVVEKIPMDTNTDEYGNEALYLSNGCHVCTPDLLLINFKQLPDGRFEQLAKLEDQSAGSWGNATLLDTSEGTVAMPLSLYGLQAVGKEKQGVLYESSYTSAGVTESVLRLLAISDTKIEDVHVALSASTNAGREEENSPLYYSFSSTWRVDDSDPSKKYYPIIMNFAGDDIDYNKKGKNKFVDMNKTQVFEFDEKKGEYRATHSYAY